MQQLAVLGEQAGVDTLTIVPGEPPLAIARRALQTARLERLSTCVMLDTAGRLHVDDELMARSGGGARRRHRRRRRCWSPMP